MKILFLCCSPGYRLDAGLGQKSTGSAQAMTFSFHYNIICEFKEYRLPLWHNGSIVAPHPEDTDSVPWLKVFSFGKQISGNLGHLSPRYYLS